MRENKQLQGVSLPRVEEGGSVNELNTYFCVQLKFIKYNYVLDSRISVEA